MIKSFFKLYFPIIFLLFSGCSKKGCNDPNAINYDSSAKKNDNSCIYEEFDKQILLTNITNNYILPSLNNYNTNVKNLDSLIKEFTQEPTDLGLSKVRDSWYNTLLTWQDISFIDFGPSTLIILKTQTNTFPADTFNIDKNITSGSWDFNTISSNDLKGFQALDYLLNKRGLTEIERITYYTNSQNARDYMNAISDELVTNIAYVVSEWSTYKNDFISDFATNASGSSVSEMINSMCLDYEFFVRRGKLGLPLGIFDLFSNDPLPGLVECYHYGQSLEFTKRSITSLQKYINGIHYSSNENGVGLDDYMNFVNASSNNENLSSVINSKIDLILTKLNNLNDPLSSELISNNSQVHLAYDAMQDLVPLVKVDMTSALGVLITYADNDGD
jgi:predicted lipoprotein